MGATRAGASSSASSNCDGIAPLKRAAMAEQQAREVGSLSSVASREARSKQRKRKGMEPPKLEK